MITARESMTLNEMGARALGVEERSDETPRTRASRAKPAPDPEVVPRPTRPGSPPSGQRQLNFPGAGKNIIRCIRSFLSVVCLAPGLGLLGTAIPGEASEDSSSSLTANLGSIDFPNSGATEAQTAFLNGMKALHSFEFEDAGEAFREAQAIDPDFALAHWGEALSYNHPLWAEQDREAAHAALARYAPTPQARAGKTPSGRERDLMEAVDVLYGSGDKLSRDIAYSEAMQHLHEVFPEDDEIATLYALSLLGTVRRGDRGFGRQMRAGAIALEVFARNPQHPGAAHFIVHAYDDPEHAILALPAAKVYAEIAPAAPHALHMPSHIFVQLGMWEGVVASNDASYKAALDHVERKGLERGRSEYHALQWYHYGQLQLGNKEMARWALDEAFRTLETFPTTRVRRGTMRMLARHTLETERWSEFDHRILTDADRNHSALQLAAGLSGVHTGNMDAAEIALANIKDARQRFLGNASTAYRAKITAVEEKELEAALALARDDDDTAEKFLADATALEAELNAPSGPPLPMKPACEMYGEFLLAQGRMEEASVQFNKALERTPNRIKSVRGLERTRQSSSDASLPQ